MRTRAARIDGDTPATTASAASAVARRVRMARATAPAAPVVRSAADPTGGAPSAADLNVTISSLDVMEGRHDGRIWWGIPSRLRARNASSAAGRRKTRFATGAPGSSRPLACCAGNSRSGCRPELWRVADVLDELWGTCHAPDRYRRRADRGSGPGVAGATHGTGAGRRRPRSPGAYGYLDHTRRGHALRARLSD